MYLGKRRCHHEHNNCHFSPYRELGVCGVIFPVFSSIERAQKAVPSNHEILLNEPKLNLLTTFDANIVHAIFLVNGTRKH
jgi:hypothetical protein